MTWLLIESLFFTNLILFTIPIKTYYKKLGSLSTMIILTACLAFLLLTDFGMLLPTTLQINTIFFSFTVKFNLEPLTVTFCFLTNILTTTTFLIIWKNPSYSSSTLFFFLYLLGFFLFHTFTSDTLIAFYFFFECTLIPMFLIIIMWGSRQRRIHAGYLFFFYTVAGSIFLLTGLFYLYYILDTNILNNFIYLKIPQTTQLILWLFFFFGFATKVPIVPLHTWLPEAHVEAPTVGSIFLAGLLLKIGTFGMLKFMFPVLTDVHVICRPLAFFLAIFSIYHASLIALRQTDLKKIIAYSSVAHMGFVILGLFTSNFYGTIGGIFIMFSHGLVSSCLFFLIGILYDRYKTKNLLQFGKLMKTMPLFTIFFFFLTLANISFPGSSNFIGELIVLLGLAETNQILALITTASIILTASYSIWSFNRISYGAYGKLKGNSDLNKLEFVLCKLFFFLIIYLGLRPNIFFTNFELSTFYYLALFTK